jgi:hypothetical protein
MKNKMVWVEVNDSNATVRIFRNRSAANAFGQERIAEQNRFEAVAEIRHQIFLRSKGFCELGGEPITEASGHLHEQIHRGKGGEISLENSVFICYDCHLGPMGAHRDRRVRFGELRNVKK